MTEDQKAISLILELLANSRQIPRTLAWLETEVRLAGRRAELPAILENMADSKLLTSERDALKIRRYAITEAGLLALRDL